MTRLELFSYPALTERDAVILSRCLGEYSEVAIDEEVIERAAAVRRRVRMKAPDAIIAASALIHSATLVTRDVAGFSRVPGLVLRSPADF